MDFASQYKFYGKSIHFHKKKGFNPKFNPILANKSLLRDFK